MQKGALLAILAVVSICSAPASAQIPGDITLDPVPGLPNFSTPVGLKHAGDDSGRIFIVELGGTVRVVDGAGTLLATPFVDIDPIVDSDGGGERGLLDIAFHPEYGVPGSAGEGKFYLHFSSEGQSAVSGTRTGDTVVAEFSDNEDSNTAVTTPDRIILTVTQDFSNHNGGQMRFGPDGYLYLALGDGGSGNDPCNRAQTLDPAALQTCGATPLNDSQALLGKMLRIDIDNTTPAGINNLCAANGNGTAEYAVPPENPFFGQADRCGEILLYGIRNPWRFSFDRQTQDIWIGDVGQGVTEEVDLLPWPVAGGDDLGWKICEGSFLRGSSSTPCPASGSILPVMEYNQAGTLCSITGGYRYRGPFPSLQGYYIFGDYCTGDVWFGSEVQGSWSFESFDAIGFGLRSFGEDEEGNVYAFDNSTLLRFNGEFIEELFADGFES